ncbi:Paired box protein Pax-2a, partial [Araneus ventricosus]|jgi:hypothetical protein
MDASN